MKILYAAYKHNPRDPEAASGHHYDYYRALRRTGADVEVVEPVKEPPLLPERILKRIYKHHPSKKYLKYNLTNTWRASQRLNKTVGDWEPDIIFTMAPPPLVFFSGAVPCILSTDTTFHGMHIQGKEYLQHGPIALRLMAWQERRAFRCCSRIITHSSWSRNVIVNEYGIDPGKVIYFPIPASLPPEVLPSTFDNEGIRPVEGTLQLLLVGRVYERKGIDIAIEVTRQLNRSGIPTKLTVVGMDGEDTQCVHFAGFYRKGDPDQLNQYVNWYRRADLLIHPARFEAAGIVPSEAAAFGVPTITNNSGGLGTTVEDGVSGVVLPRGSPAETYTKAISELISDPDRYTKLCLSTRERFEEKLNWNAAGKLVANVLEEAMLNFRRSD